MDLLSERERSGAIPALCRREASSEADPEILTRHSIGPFVVGAAGHELFFVGVGLLLDQTYIGAQHKA